MCTEIYNKFITRTKKIKITEKTLNKTVNLKNTSVIICPRHLEKKYNV